MLIIILVLVFFIIYLYTTKNHSYWKERNVKYYPPIPFFGNHLENMCGKKSVSQLCSEYCKKYPNEKLIGFYRGTTPALIIQDLDLSRHILSTDFTSFSHRGLGRDPQLDPLSKNLFHVDGDIWKLLWQRLTPAFTAAKLRAMFPLVVGCAERLRRVCGTGGVQDARELMARFTIECIGACGFGIDMDSINNEQSQYRALGRLIFNLTGFRYRFPVHLFNLYPDLKHSTVLISLLRALKMDSGHIYNAIKEILQQIWQQRNFQPSGRRDFIDILLELEKLGKITGESIEKYNTDGSPVLVEMEMDLSCLVAQAFIFFAAGFETSSMASSYTLHELAYNPEVQRAVQEDIDRVMLKYNNQVCYDGVVEMTLLNQALKEGLRKFPPGGVLPRVCTRRYTFPGTSVTIDPGTLIYIPVQKIHMDERYYDDPEEFRLDRFSLENVKKRHKYSYLPFGFGPRACVGEKLGRMQSLAGLVAILHQFTVEPAPDSKRQVTVNPYSNTVQGVIGALNLNFKLRRQA